MIQLRSLAQYPSSVPPASIGPNISHPMASAVLPPRQLAPTVGPVAALARVFIRTGNFLRSGKRVLSGMMQRFGSLHFVHDNAGCFSQGPAPCNGNLVTIGKFDVYVAIAPRPFVYPQAVHVAADPPAVIAARGRRSTRPASCEVMMIVVPPGTDLGKAVEIAIEATARVVRPSKPAYERMENRADPAGTSSAPSSRNVIRLAIHELSKPLDDGTDPVQA